LALSLEQTESIRTFDPGWMRLAGLARPILISSGQGLLR
jgi:hypothetical protein